MQETRRERCLWMTEEEAMGLLDIAIMCPGEMTPAQRAALGKLSEFCRQFLREEDPAAPSLTLVNLPDAPAFRAA